MTVERDQTLRLLSEATRSAHAALLLITDTLQDTQQAATDAADHLDQVAAECATLGDADAVQLCTMLTTPDTGAVDRLRQVAADTADIEHTLTCAADAAVPLVDQLQEAAELGSDQRPLRYPDPDPSDTLTLQQGAVEVQQTLQAVDRSRLLHTAAVTVGWCLSRLRADLDQFSDSDPDPLTVEVCELLSDAVDHFDWAAQGLVVQSQTLAELRQAADQFADAQVRHSE